MTSAASATQSLRTTSWSSRSLTTLIVLFMVFDGVIHVVQPTPVVDAFAQLGYPLRLSLGIGVIELAFTTLYAIPRTSALGALLLTAYLGGATATQLRVEPGWFPIIFPSLLGAMLWGGLALRDRRVFALFSPGNS